MPAQIFLITPAGTPVDALAAVLAAASVSAVLLTRGDLSENGYKTAAKLLVPVVQAAGSAALIEGDPGLVRMLDADGLNVVGSDDEVELAIASLKPQLIVGAAAVESRDDAMTKGELGVDYVLFEADDTELARWWAETMEIPAVLNLPAAAVDTLDTLGCEFVALSDSVWSHPEGPAAAIAALATRLGEL